MAEKKKYYTIDQKKHTITIDTTVPPQKGDEEAVALYIKFGYDMRIKSQDRAEKMRNRANSLDAATIREALKNDEKALKKFDEIVHGKRKESKDVGFFVAKKWYKDYLNKKKEEKK